MILMVEEDSRKYARHTTEDTTYRGEEEGGMMRKRVRRVMRMMTRVMTRMG
jgi:hypothetical protein